MVHDSSANEDHHHASASDPLLGDKGGIWNSAFSQDEVLRTVKDCLSNNSTRLPPGSSLKVSLSKFSLEDGRVYFCKRVWVPLDESLRTKLIQGCQDSMPTGHLGHEGTYAIVARQFFWPSMSENIRQFCRNCRDCRRNQIWRQQRQGLLKPLPVPSRIWSDISVDFIDQLPLSLPRGAALACSNIMVITDRLS